MRGQHALCSEGHVCNEVAREPVNNMRVLYLTYGRTVGLSILYTTSCRLFTCSLSLMKQILNIMLCSGNLIRKY